MTLVETGPNPKLSWAEICVDRALEIGTLPGLTPAERIVVAELRQGLSNREIARHLGKSEITVKNQVGSALRKLGAPSRARLIALLR